MMTSEEVDRTVYGLLVAYEEQHYTTIAPKDLLATVMELYPNVPELAWREAAIRMYRQRSEEQMQEANELWLEGELEAL